MTWFGVLTVKETVARLFELNDIQQCSKASGEGKCIHAKTFIAIVILQIQ